MADLIDCQFKGKLGIALLADVGSHVRLAWPVQPVSCGDQRSERVDLSHVNKQLDRVHQLIASTRSMRVRFLVVRMAVVRLGGMMAILRW